MIELQHAVIIDFEGEGKSLVEELSPLPHMIGIYEPNKQHGAKYRWVTFQESWTPAVNGSSSNATIENFSVCFESLLKKLDPEKGRLVHWSMYEEQILKHYLMPETWQKVGPVLYNARVPAKKYVRANRLLESVVGVPLEGFFAKICSNSTAMPTLKLGAAEVCRRVDNACLENPRWRNFSNIQKKLLHDLVSYNHGDCKATWKILKKITNAGY